MKTTCCTFNLKATATYEIIGKIMNYEYDQTSDYELQGFMLQIHHQNVVITGHDFFTIDMNLMVSVSLITVGVRNGNLISTQNLQIISATITYIIVIIQA